ncbi:MAG: cob(I)yrinic acid a,c-diamide adenosyltransferase [Candidatus Thermoplasmatota archaeon]
MGSGYVYVYSGAGKGKTLAALGFGLKSVSSGLKVYMIRFVKINIYSELSAVKNLPNFEIVQFGRTNFDRENIQKIDFKLAREGLERAKEVIHNGKYDVVILDEINLALDLKLIDLEDVLAIIKNRKNCDVVLTGKYAHPKVIKIADFATEFLDIKHQPDKELLAKVGVDYRNYIKNLGYSAEKITELDK